MVIFAKPLNAKYGQEKDGAKYETYSQTRSFKNAAKFVCLLKYSTLSKSQLGLYTFKKLKPKKKTNKNAFFPLINVELKA